ncbi:hypothetical protein GOP47_0025472 [Adiantum capillus-veneris]|uniref:Uncharacterized protein n=1 Tax=Adiantum capillus-veneris TaxID=13818 RepID=A0A9D4Z2A7_ADICA|nr:hypothetical protein GOP47_0025472 [Adiantum capillus-veneris]
MTSCSGLPICLSGIQMYPQSQRPLSRRVRSHVQPRPRTSPACARVRDGESMGSDCEASTPSSNIVRDHGDAHEERNSELFPNSTATWPRLALAQQMADLDYRREAVRRRSLQNRSHLMDYRVSPQQNDMMVACLESQARSEEDSSCIPKSLCAKAA